MAQIVAATLNRPDYELAIPPQRCSSSCQQPIDRRSSNLQTASLPDQPCGTGTLISRSGSSMDRPEQCHTHHAFVKVRQTQYQRLPLALIYDFGFFKKALGLRL